MNLDLLNNVQRSQPMEILVYPNMTMFSFTTVTFFTLTLVSLLHVVAEQTSFTFLSLLSV